MFDYVVLAVFPCILLPSPTLMYSPLTCTQTRIQRLMKQVSEAQLKEVYDELGMPYAPKATGHEAERTPEEDGLRSSNEADALTETD